MGVIPSVSKGIDNGTFFDVLVLYTEGFAEEYPGDELYAQISYLMGVANTCYSNNEVDLSARVVELQEVDYTDDGMLSDALDDLTSGKGIFSNVPSLRNQAGADLVTLLRVFTVTGEYDYPVEGEVVTAKVNKEGKKRITVSTSNGITDSNGQATFTITASKKKENAKVKFKADCLKKSVKVKVE